MDSKIKCGHNLKSTTSQTQLGKLCAACQKPCLFFVFQVLLSYKLDDIYQTPWTSLFIPLHISLLALVVGAFGSKGGNKCKLQFRTAVQLNLAEIYPVISPASMPCTTFYIVCFYQPAFCRVCVFILWASCLLINK